jgi:hypothetical protein
LEQIRGDRDYAVHRTGVASESVDGPSFLDEESCLTATYDPCAAYN